MICSICCSSPLVKSNISFALCSNTVPLVSVCEISMGHEKSWAIKLATEAARTVLSVDQIIVARQAGGPKMPGKAQQGNWDNDD